MPEIESQDALGSSLKVVAYPAFKNVSANPYNSLLYSEIKKHGVRVIESDKEYLRHGIFDILHVHWPENFLNRESALSTFRSCRKILSLFDKVRRKGSKIIWTIHEARAHEQYYPFWENQYLLGLAKRLDAVISMNKSSLKLARNSLLPLSNVPSFVIPHGHYRSVYPNSLSRIEARSRLGISPSSFVFAYFGMIRPYKNVPLLIRAFRELDRPDTVLLVAGNPQGQAHEREVVSAAKGSDSVRLVLNRIDNEEIQVYLNAADLVVLPFKRICNSGSTLLGLSFDRPVLVPRIGAMAELQNSIGRNWVQTYDGDLTSEALREAINWVLHDSRGKLAPLDDLGWSSIACQTIEAYRTVTGNHN